MEVCADAAHRREGAHPRVLLGRRLLPGARARMELHGRQGVWACELCVCVNECVHACMHACMCVSEHWARGMLRVAWARELHTPAARRLLPRGCSPPPPPPPHPLLTPAGAPGGARLWRAGGRRAGARRAAATLGQQRPGLSVQAGSGAGGPRRLGAPAQVDRCVGGSSRACPLCVWGWWSARPGAQCPHNAPPAWRPLSTPPPHAHPIPTPQTLCLGASRGGRAPRRQTMSSTTSRTMRWRYATCGRWVAKEQGCRVGRAGRGAAARGVAGRGAAAAVGLARLLPSPAVLRPRVRAG